MSNTIHLQGLGDLPAILASDLRVGMKLSWNYSYCGYEVVSIEEASAKFLKVVERNVKTGQEFTRRLKKDRLVAAK